MGLFRAQVEVAQRAIVARCRHRLGDQILQRGANLAHLTVIGLVELERKLRLGLLLLRLVGNVLVVVIRRVHTTARTGGVVAFVLLESGGKTRGAVWSGGKGITIGIVLREGALQVVFLLVQRSSQTSDADVVVLVAIAIRSGAYGRSDHPGYDAIPPDRLSVGMMMLLTGGWLLLVVRIRLRGAS